MDISNVQTYIKNDVKISDQIKPYTDLRNSLWPYMDIKPYQKIYSQDAELLTG